MNFKHKIKILFRHRSMEMGGVEKVLLNILNNLDPDKFDMTVCLNLNQGELRNEIPSHVRKVALTKGKEDMSSSVFVQKLQLLSRIKRLRKFDQHPKIVDQKILKDIYDIEVAMTYNDFDMVLKSTNKYSKKVGWFHSEIHVPKMKPLVPKILEQFPQFDTMVYCSQRIKDLMHEHHPNLNFPEEKVIINAIPIAEIKKKAEAYRPDLPKAPVFFSMARLHTRKGFHKLVEAHARLIEDGFFHHVYILGEGEEHQNLNKQIKSLGVEDTFIIKPFEMNPYPYLKNADFYILPSESEAWPLVIAEALILKIPTIATNVGDVGMMIKDQETGHLISYKTEDIYQAMKVFLTDKEYVSSIRKNLETIETQFDNRIIYQEIEKTFLTLLKK